MSIAFSLFLAFTELPHIDKLVFESAHQIYAVIASQCVHWRGNPPVERNRVTITTKIATLSYSVGQSSNILPLTGGLPRPVCALVSQ